MPHIIALDFDGVLCDSAGETGVAAWRAGQAFWPAWQSAEPPPVHLERFRRCRPVIETGFETIVLMRLIDLDISDQRIWEGFAELRDELLAEHRLSRQELIEQFSATRDRWIAGDPSDWLSRHQFYPGSLPRLQASLSAADQVVYVVTTKQERFVAELLQGSDVALPVDRIYGFDAGKSKEQVLRELQQRHQGCTLSFVEDRLPTLERVMQQGDLTAVQLYLAGWGYLLPGDAARAAATDRVRVWTLADFLQNFRQCPGSKNSSTVACC